MTKKPDEIKPKDTAALEITEATDSSAPDFLKEKCGPPGEPEWHLKDLERPLEKGVNSLVEVTLDDEPQPVSPTSTNATEVAAPPPKPQPADLTPEMTSPTHNRKPDTSGQRGSPLQPVQHLPTAISAHATLHQPVARQPVVHPLDETAFERDMRRHMPVAPEESGSPAPEDLGQVKYVGPTGQLISDGRVLRFPDSTRFGNGDIVICNERRFRVKLQRRHPALVYGKPAGLLVVALLALIGISTFFSGPPTESLTGVVVDAANGKIIVGADVSLRGGLTTRTNMAGMYTFAGLAPGTYEVRVSMPGYSPTSQTASRTGSQDASLSFALEPLYASTVAIEQKPVEVAAADNETQNKEKTSEYGAVKLVVDFTGYMLYLDSKVVGKDISKLTKIDPGDHQVMVEKEQFEEYRVPVTVKPRRTAEVTIALRDLKPKTTRQQRAKDRYAEGKTALDGEQYQDAIKAFDAALAEQSEYPEARQYRGWAFRKLGKSESASADLQAAAELYALSNRYLEAVTCANLLVDMHPDKGEYLVMRGDYHTALGELKPAIADYEAAANRDAKSLKFRLALAEGYYRAGQFKEAAREFEKARKMTDNPVDIYVRLILSYMYAGKDKDLVKRYAEFTGIAPPEKIERLRNDPEWLRVLQLIGPEAKSKNP